MEKQSGTTEQMENPNDFVEQSMKTVSDAFEQPTNAPQATETPPEPQAQAPEESVPEEEEPTKASRGVVAILAFLCVASLGTGILHWYRNYYNPTEYVSHVNAGFTSAEGQDEEPQNNEQAEIEQQQDYVAIAPDENESAESAEPIKEQAPEMNRPSMEPLPKFIELWDTYGNDDIFAVLTLADNEILVMQADNNVFYLIHDINREPSEIGMAFLDYSVDLLLGFDHNMVVYAPLGTVLSQVLREYVNYDFFLANPTISFSTLYGNFDWEIFAFYIAPNIFPFMTVNHPNDDIWGDVVEQFTLAALYNTRLDVTQYDQIITIASPTEPGSRLYYVLQARMLRQITS